MRAVTSPFATRLSGQVCETLNRVFDDLYDRDLFSGVVSLSNGDSVLWQAAYGLADRGAKIANTLQTRFNIGSINKMWTALAVMQLVEQGKLQLTDTVDQHLGAEWLAPAVAKTITIRQLLDHTAGLGNYFSERFERSSRRDFRSVADFGVLVFDRKPAYVPGSQSSYSDIGFLLAGAIIEKVAQRDYFDHIRAQITGPLGMENSEAFDLEEVHPRLAIGYHRMPLSGLQGPLDPAASLDMSFYDRFTLARKREEYLIEAGFFWRNNLFMHVVKGGPAGGYFSTAGDLRRLALGLRNQQVVSSDSWRLMTTPSAHCAKLGLGVMLDNGSVGHSGNFPGISAQFSMFPDGHDMVVLANSTNAAGIATAELYRALGWDQIQPR